MLMQQQNQIVDQLSTEYNFKKMYSFRLLNEAKRTLERTEKVSVRMKGLLDELEECLEGGHFSRKFLDDFHQRDPDNYPEKNDYLSSFSNKNCIKDSFIVHLDSFPHLKGEMKRRGYEIFRDSLTKKLPRELEWLAGIQQIEMRMAVSPVTNLPRYKLFYRYLDEYLEMLNNEKIEYLKKCEEFILQQEKALLEEGYREMTPQYLHLAKGDPGGYAFSYLKMLLPCHTVLSCVMINESKNKIVLLLE